MSARITKLSFGPRPLDTPDHGDVKKYVQELTIKIQNEDDLEPLERLITSAEQENAQNIYLIEFAPGPKQLFRTASTGSILNEEAPGSCQEHLFEEDIINRLTDMFKENLGVPQTLFENHTARGPKFRFSEEFAFPSAPTALEADKSFVLRYYEFISYTGKPSTLSVWSELDDVGMVCTSTGRQIQCHQWQGCRIREGMLLIVPHKCSFWVRKKNEGYTAVILCDPEPESVQIDSESTTPIKPHVPFNGGYPDFGPCALSHGQRSLSPPHTAEPPRTSFAADLAFYLQNYGDILDTNGLDSLTLYIKKLVAAHYMPLIAFVSFQISSMRSRGWALGRNTEQERAAAAMVESDWSRFRCSEYLEDMEANLDALGVDPKVKGRYNDWKACEMDFKWIHEQLMLRRDDYDRLTTSMSALAGIIGTRQALEETRLQKEESMRALREAKSTKTLTVIAMAFAPMAWTSQLFSMTDLFVPGGREFWVYFAVSLPLTLFVFILAIIADRGYNDRAEWSVETFKRSCGRLLKKSIGRSGTRSVASRRS